GGGARVRPGVWIAAGAWRFRSLVMRHTTKMARHYSRSPLRRAPRHHGHWKTLTLVAAQRIDGLTTPYVIDGSMNGPTFLDYVEQVLVPTLRKGDIIFMDNLRPHKIDGMRQAIVRR